MFLVVIIRTSLFIFIVFCLADFKIMNASKLLVEEVILFVAFVCGVDAGIIFWLLHLSDEQTPTEGCRFSFPFCPRFLSKNHSGKGNFHSSIFFLKS
jgi:hypothetical protein